MNFAVGLNNKLTALSDYVRGSKKRAVLFGGLIYTVFFAAFVIVYLAYDISVTGGFLGSDAVSANYPCLIEFRRSIIAFFESLKSGNPELSLINIDYLYGTDTCASASMFLALFPIYIFSALIPVSALPAFFTAVIIFTSYISGLSFMYLCAHYKRDMIWSGLLAPFYVFCGNYFYTGALNPHFMYMYMAFPLMIIGMDRIIKEKGGWVILGLSVGWISLLGIPFIVYTVPFVVVFAIIRVYFTHKETFFKSLGKYFLRGSASIVLGLGVFAFGFLIYVMSFLSSVRTVGGESIDFLSLLIPSFDYTLEFLSGEGIDIKTSTAAGVIVVFIYLFTSARTKTEIKCMSFVMLLLVALPFIRYGLNGFNYDLCRWGFIPALFVSFCGIDGLPKLMKIKGSERTMFLFVIITYTLLYTFNAREAAVIFMLAMALVNAVPPLRKLIIRLGRKIKRFVISLKGKGENKRGILPLIIVSVSVIALLMVIIYIIMTKSFTPAPIFLIVVFGTIISVALSSKKILKSFACILLVAIQVVTGLTYIKFGPVSEIAESPVIEEMAKLEAKENTFGRVALFNRDCNVAQIAKEEEDLEEVLEKEEKEEEETAEETNSVTLSKFGYYYSTDLQLNLAIRYGIASSEAFQSIVDGNFVKFLLRCGQSPDSLYSAVVVLGLGSREVLYSMFGFNDLVSGIETDHFYGIEVDREYEYGEDEKAYLYKNEYAFPAGVTYDTFINEERFNELNGAELPYAMVNDLYLEGYEAAEYVSEEYSDECDIVLKQELRGETSYGMTCYDNYITVNSDTKNSFIYLSFEGVNSSTFTNIYEENFVIKADNGLEYNYTVHNRNSNWNWKIVNDRYVFPLGFSEEGLKEIEFVSPFEFESVKVYSVPENIYTDAYYERTEDILEDFETSTNSASGNISLSKDKVLVISLLHNDGWTAYVDGEKAPIYKANGIFIGIPLTAGEHSIELHYVTPYLTEGIIISAVSLAILIAICIISRKKKEKENA